MRGHNIKNSNTVKATLLVRSTLLGSYIIYHMINDILSTLQLTGLVRVNRMHLTFISTYIYCFKRIL